MAKFKSKFLRKWEWFFPWIPWTSFGELLPLSLEVGTLLGPKPYRQLHSIPNDWGTAVNVQSMVFGNMSQDSATGVMFTRNPSTGEKRLYGEFLLNAQGEDVVAGIRTPLPIIP